jgi:WD40 repeat protein
MVTGSEDKTVRLWEVSTGRSLSEPLKWHEFNVNAVTFSPDGRRIVSGSEDSKICIWDGATDQPVFVCH